MILPILRVLAMTFPLSRGVMTVPRPAGQVTPTAALVHSFHAQAAATDRVDAETLAYLGWRETRYKPKYRPQCGVTQIEVYGDRKLCATLVADPALAYRTAAKMLEDALDLCRKNRRPGWDCALTWYGKGTEAALTGDYAKARRSLRMIRRLRRG